jgi:hypothetical protein
MEMKSPGPTEKETSSRATMRVVARSLTGKILVTPFTVKEDPSAAILQAEPATI